MRKVFETFMSQDFWILQQQEKNFGQRDAVFSNPRIASTVGTVIAPCCHHWWLVKPANIDMLLMEKEDASITSVRLSVVARVGATL